MLMNKLASMLAAAMLSPLAIAQCTILGTGTQILPVPFDSWTAIQPIGFTFSFAGTTYTDLYISDHGLISLSNAGVPAAPASGGFLWSPSTASLVAAGAPIIAPYWSDHTTGGGSIWIDNTSGTSCTVTWVDAQTYLNQQPPFSTSVTLFPSGRIEMRLDSRVNNSGSTFGALNAIVGLSPNGAVLPAASDLSAGVNTAGNETFFEEFITTGAATPNPLFDLADRMIVCTPTFPGWTVTTELLPTIIPAGTQITPTPVDAFTALQPIGFAFPFNGATYSDLYISDHGIVALSNGGVPASPGNGSFTYTVTSASLAVGGPKIAAYWSDANCNANNTAAGIFIDNTSGNHCTVTWWNSETYFNQRPPFTVQMTLFSDGRVTVSLENRVTNNGSSFDLDAVIGMGNGAATPLPAASDLSAGLVTNNPTVFEQWTTSATGTPNPLFDVGGRTLTFFPANPGWVVTNDPLRCAAKQTYGVGCNGLALDSNKPIFGTTWNLTTTGIDPISPIAITFFGPSFVPGVPLPAIGINAPGCNIYLGAVFVNLAASNIGGTSVLPIAIPLNVTLQGASLSAQSLCLTLLNPATMSTSNGVEGTIGF